MNIPRIRLKSQDEYNLLMDYRNRHKALAQECDSKGIPIENVKSYWHKTKHISINVKQDGEKVDYLAAIQEIVAELPKRTIITPRRKDKASEKAVKATVTDMHVGLEPNPNGNSLFQYEYNAEIFEENLDKVFDSLMKEYHLHGKFELLLLDDLGDGVDGWNGFTTRGGHKLPQNQTNIQTFKTYVKGKLRLIERVIEADIAQKIIVRNVSDCNHGGDFGHIANSAIQMILERSYEKSHVEFYILQRFMEHFEYGDHTFILTHGKDKELMFKGLPYILDDKTIKFLNSYIDHYEIRSKYIHVEKGDLHQIGYARTKKFDYRNYMSFAPPSSWVQNNFGDTYSGYSVQVVPKYSNEISHSDYFFELKKARLIA